MAMGSGSEGRGSIFRFDNRRDSGSRHNRRHRAVSRVHAPGLHTGTDTAHRQRHDNAHTGDRRGGARRDRSSGFWLARSSGYSPFCRRTIRSSSTLLSPLCRACSSVWWRGPSSSVLRRWSVDLAAAAAGLLGSFANTVGVVGLAILFGLLPVAVYSGHLAAGHSRGRSGRGRYGRHRQGCDALPQRAGRRPRRTSLTKNAAISQGAARAR